MREKMRASSSNTRWCPTPEQLMVLEELYRRGLRSPKAQQIQKITAHLSLYGNIQGKNVFYWFQNHKARDRQKLRKKHLLHHHFQIPSSQTIHFQGSGVCEEVPGLTWRSSYGHDSVMIMEVGPTPSPSPRSRSQPPRTLELFPLRPPTAANDPEIRPTTS